MADSTLTLQSFLGRANLQQLAGPILILVILSMMVLPLPPFMLDLFFTFNIAISVIVMLVAIKVMKPLDLSVFPTVLLITTLLRLSLNVASTRIVLLEGHTGPGAAGQVIEAFGLDRRRRSSQAARNDCRGGGFLRLDGWCFQVRSWRCCSRHPDYVHQRHRRPVCRCSAT